MSKSRQGFLDHQTSLVSSGRPSLVKQHFAKSAQKNPRRRAYANARREQPARIRHWTRLSDPRCPTTTFAEAEKTRASEFGRPPDRALPRNPGA